MLPCLILDLAFRAEQACYLPQPAGPMLRGAFGYALKRLVCVMKGRPCQGCPLEQACVYPSVFAPKPPPGSPVMRLYDKAPVPFTLRVLSGGGPTEAGGLIRLRLTLIGSAERTAPFVLRAFAEAGERGLGRGRAPFRLEDVRTGDGAPALDEAGRLVARAETLAPEALDPARCPAAVDVRFESPVRLQALGALVTPERFDVARFCMAAVRRVGLLAQLYADPPQADFRALKEACGRVELIARSLGWREATRYSTRQNAALQVGGLVGSLSLGLGQAREVWPYLVEAGRVGVGKATTMGFGAVALQAR